MTLGDIADFVATRARTATHPVFGDIDEVKPKPSVKKDNRSQPRRATIFATKEHGQEGRG